MPTPPNRDVFDSLGEQATGYAQGPPIRDSPLLEPGTLLAGKYRIDRLLGRGGMGTVYSAFDTISESHVAVKMLSPGLTENEGARRRFLQEFRITQQLSHPNIVRAYAVDRHGDQFFYTMQMVEGRSLREVLREKRERGESLDIQQVIGIIRALADALEHAHRITIHRDIKPDNVLLGPDGQPMLVDFGIAKALQSTDVRTRVASAMGTAY